MNYTREINSINHWRVAEDYFSKNGYKLWQIQYDIHSPEGFHAYFGKVGNPDIEIITFSNEVYKAILSSKK